MRIVFIGTGQIGLPTLTALQAAEHELVAVVTQPDKPAGRHQRLEASPIKKTASEAKLPVLQPLRIKDPDSVAEIAALHPDVIVVMAYGQILPRSVLTIPPLGCLNLHASLLPRWRGAAPVQAAIAAGDRETGITVMYMDEGLDTGDILLERKIAIAPEEESAALQNRLAALAPDALLEALSLIATGKAPRVPQENAQATYAPKLTRQAGRIDWSQPAEVIERKIRAFTPWPGAYTTITTQSRKRQHLKILSAAMVATDRKPGQVWQSNNELIVAAGNGALSLREIQLEGKRPMSAAEFLRGHPPPLEIIS
jgi:methionyl-tRNA formyltransferase